MCALVELNSHVKSDGDSFYFNFGIKQIAEVPPWFLSEFCLFVVNFQLVQNYPPSIKTVFKALN